MKIRTRYTRRRGFNLIEIAIVLAVIGLVIGGIYTAAGAVTENNRQQTLNKEIFTIIQNIRISHASQNRFTPLSYAQIKAMGLFPAEMDTGTQYQTPYGGQVSLVAAVLPTSFGLVIANLPKSACVRLLVQTLGNPSIAGALAMTMVPPSTTTIDPQDGITPLEATAFCSSNLMTLTADVALR